jgi:hypothetical protein
MKKMLEYALEYAARGWFVFPCREKDGQLYQDESGKLHLPRAKSPYVKFGLNVATTDPAQIKTWWNRWPAAAIGCNCGKSGLFVLDLDVKGDVNGWEYFRDFMPFDHSGAFHSVTPSGGFHIIYSGEGKSASRKEIGIDTRGKGGYIILPPSEIGELDYCQADDWTGNPAPIPAGMLEYLFPPKVESERPTRDYPADPDHDFKQARKAINAINPDRAENYSDWVKIGMALTKLGSSGLTLWHEFSKRDRRPGKYIAAELDAKWEKIQDTAVTLGSLFYYANQDAPEWWRE